MRRTLSYCVAKRLHILAQRTFSSRRLQPLQEDDHFKLLYEQVKDKMLHNCRLAQMHLDHGNRVHYLLNAKKRIQEVKQLKQLKNSLPYALQFMDDVDQSKLVYVGENTAEQKSVPQGESAGSTDLPFSRVKTLGVEEMEYEEVETKIPEDWMVEYEMYDDVKFKIKKLVRELKEENNVDDKDEEMNEIVEKYTRGDSREKGFYGIPNPNIPSSDIPCGGCGALLHCKDTSIPGYLPSEIFTSCKKNDLKSLVCQRCHFLKEYNVALNLNVDPSEYPKLLNVIKEKHALVVIMVDMTDFPCSIWPGIMDIVGRKKPVFVVGNKTDLLPVQSKGFLREMEKCLENEVRKSALKNANIKHVTLISAKTGFGVEDLITNLYYTWKTAGDVFLIGCTNCGKSTLFNALIQSDYCKVKAMDLLQRATISQWPGTTMNLLKFPIMRQSNPQIAKRMKRLAADIKLEKAELDFRNQQLQITGDVKYATLIGRIGLTYKQEEEENKYHPKDPFAYTSNRGRHPQVFDENKPHFYRNKWCYDTPGVIHPEQILSILTIEELMNTLPKTLLQPRTFYMKPGMSLFIAGLSRLDLVSADEGTRFTVFASHHLPVTICRTEDAEEVYQKSIGTELFVVPEGGEQRLSKWPGLTKAPEDFETIGVNSRICCADIVLSSSGWVAVSTKSKARCVVAAWTPNARGIYLRSPPLLPHAVMQRGDRISGSPMYKKGYKVTM